MKVRTKRVCAVAAALITGFCAVITGGTAQAAGAANHADSYATYWNPTSFHVAFQVQQFNSRYVAVHNEADATSANCNGCRSIAIAFQIVTDAEKPTHVDAGNHGTALNTRCNGCQTLAAAYQFVVAKPTLLDWNDTAKLYQIDFKLQMLRYSNASTSTIAHEVDALAHDVASILAHSGKAYAQWPIIHRYLTMHD